MTALPRVAAQLVSDGRGILAADESIKTMSARLEAEGIAASATSRRDYRELLLTPPRLSDTVSGIILCEETFDDRTAGGVPFPQACRELGILPGIKVDTGTSVLPRSGGATVTEGLDGLGARLADFSARGAAFAKWRAVIDISTTTARSLEANAHALGRYAALCQEHGIVPVVEPEVLATGTHDLRTCAETTERALSAVFEHLARNQVDVGAIVLKPNMVTPGLGGEPADPETVAAATLGVLGSFVPHSVPGIAFLSGGQPNLMACANLGAINAIAGSAPWALTYSFGRALVSDALRAWHGEPGRVDEAQQVLLDNCSRASAATRTGLLPAPA